LVNATRAKRHDVSNTGLFPSQGYLKRWRLPVMQYLLTFCRQQPAFCRRADIYEFGVFTGRALRAMNLFLSRNNLEVGAIHGFDSFVGMPEDAPTSAPSTPMGPRGRYSNYVTAGSADASFGLGSFNVTANLGARDVASAMAAVASYVNVTRPPWSLGARVNLIPGFFNVSLTPTLVAERGMAPALYVDMDMDIYRSAFEVLDWLCANGLLVNGTVLGYDDFNYGLVVDAAGRATREGWRDGESRAHREIEAKWGLVVRQLTSVPTTGPGSGWAFVVEGVGRSGMQP